MLPLKMLLVLPVGHSTQADQSNSGCQEALSLREADAPLTKEKPRRGWPQQLHDGLSVAWMSPAIAVDAADQHLTVMVDLH
jgi:hypothetical protein